MKKIILSAVVAVILFSCKKEKETITAQPIVAQNQILEKKVSVVVTPTSSFTETFNYAMNADTTVYTYSISGSTDSNEYKYHKQGNQLLGRFYFNGVFRSNLIYWLNSLNYVDTSASILTNGSITSTTKCTYYPDGTLKTNKTDQTSNSSLTTFYYYENESPKYRIRDFVRLTPPLTTTRDSTVFIYLTERTNAVSHVPEIDRIYGKPDKLLPTKAITYSLPTGTLKQEDTFTYTFNSKGNVETRLWVRKDLTTNTELRRDNTTYTYKQ